MTPLAESSLRRLVAWEHKYLRGTASKSLADLPSIEIDSRVYRPIEGIFVRRITDDQGRLLPGFATVIAPTLAFRALCAIGPGAKMLEVTESDSFAVYTDELVSRRTVDELRSGTESPMTVGAPALLAAACSASRLGRLWWVAFERAYVCASAEGA